MDSWLNYHHLYYFKVIAQEEHRACLRQVAFGAAHSERPIENPREQTRSASF